MSVTRAVLQPPIGWLNAAAYPNTARAHADTLVIFGTPRTRHRSGRRNERVCGRLARRLLEVKYVTRETSQVPIWPYVCWWTVQLPHGASARQASTWAFSSSRLLGDHPAQAVQKTSKTSSRGARARAGRSAAPCHGPVNRLER